MKNDRKIKESVKRISELSREYLSMPNPCAYTDSILDKILQHAEKLRELHETNQPG